MKTEQEIHTGLERNYIKTDLESNLQSFVIVIICVANELLHNAMRILFSGLFIQIIVQSFKCLHFIKSWVL